uniref:Uncharacterized protein n=1 Tax=Arundo donax TaxID=35708 RepID=A0A0A9D404_ARUDO
MARSYMILKYPCCPDMTTFADIQCNSLGQFLDQLRYYKKKGHSTVFHFDDSFLSHVKLYVRGH